MEVIAALVATVGITFAMWIGCGSVSHDPDAIVKDILSRPMIITVRNDKGKILVNKNFNSINEFYDYCNKKRISVIKNHISISRCE